jgi:hypothetical protein
MLSQPSVVAADLPDALARFRPSVLARLSWLVTGLVALTLTTACSEDNASAPKDAGTTTDTTDPGDTSDSTGDTATTDTDAQGDVLTGDDADAVGPGSDTSTGLDGGPKPDSSVGPEEYKDLLVKILGPTGREWTQSTGQLMQLSGVAFGIPDSMSWKSSSGKSGTIKADTYWKSGTIELAPGDNVLTVTAIKGDQTSVDTIHITYNQVFQFDGPPVINPNVVFVGETNKVVVQFVAPAAGASEGTVPIVDPSSIKLIETDKDGKTVAGFTADLFDNGNGGNCDDVQKDTVFSNCLNFSANQAGTRYFRVQASVDIPGIAKYTALSPVTVVDVVPRWNKTECKALVSLQKSVKADYEKAIAGGTSWQVAREAAIADLKADATVENAGSATGDGYSVWVHYKTGRVGALNLAPAGLRSGASAPGLDDSNAALPTYSVGARRALTLAPSSSEFTAAGGDESEVAAAALKAQQCPPFATDSFSNDNAYLKGYREVASYGFVSITGHGDVLFEGMDQAAKEALGWEHTGAQEVVWSGEPVNCDALSSSPASCNQAGSGCPKGETCVKTSKESGICVDQTQADIMTGRVVIGDSTYGALPALFARHVTELMPQSIVYIGTCRSMQNGSLAVQLWGAGAQAVVGYSDYVSQEWAAKVGAELVTGLISEGKSVLQAITAETDGLGGRMRMLGNGKANLTDSKLINASWDQGRLTGWKPAGDGRVVSRLGVTIPVAGKYMGIVSTGLGFTAQTGSLSQPFCADGGESQLCFHWKFYSEEFIEFCGSAYMDTFTATLSSDVLKKTLVNVYIDTLCPYDCGGKNPCEPGSPSCKCGQDWKGLSPSDVNFDVGGVFVTPWQKTCLDISALAGTGKKADLSFFATDKGDSIYDTVILIDEVSVK